MAGTSAKAPVDSSDEENQPIGAPADIIEDLTVDAKPEPEPLRKRLSKGPPAAPRGAGGKAHAPKRCKPASDGKAPAGKPKKPEKPKASPTPPTTPPPGDDDDDSSYEGDHDDKDDDDDDDESFIDSDDEVPGSDDEYEPSGGSSDDDDDDDTPPNYPESEKDKKWFTKVSLARKQDMLDLIKEQAEAHNQLTPEWWDKQYLCTWQHIEYVMVKPDDAFAPITCSETKLQQLTNGRAFFYPMPSDSDALSVVQQHIWTMGESTKLQTWRGARGETGTGHFSLCKGIGRRMERLLAAFEENKMSSFDPSTSSDSDTAVLEPGDGDGEDGDDDGDGGGEGEENRHDECIRRFVEMWNNPKGGWAKLPELCFYAICYGAPHIKGDVGALLTFENVGSTISERVPHWLGDFHRHSEVAADKFRRTSRCHFNVRKKLADERGVSYDDVIAVAKKRVDDHLEADIVLCDPDLGDESTLLAIEVVDTHDCTDQKTQKYAKMGIIHRRVRASHMLRVLKHVEKRLAADLRANPGVSVSHPIIFLEYLPKGKKRVYRCRECFKFDYDQNAPGAHADGDASDGAQSCLAGGEEVAEHVAAEQAAADEAAVDEAAVDEAAADEAAVDEAAADEAVVDEAAVDEAAVDEAAVDEAAVDEAAVDEAAVDEAAVDEAAADEAAVDEAAAYEAAADEAPAPAPAPAPSPTTPIFDQLKAMFLEQMSKPGAEQNKRKIDILLDLMEECAP